MTRPSAMICKPQKQGARASSLTLRFELLRVDRRANSFEEAVPSVQRQLGPRHEEEFVRLGHPGSRVDDRIGDGDDQFHLVGRDTTGPLLQPHVLAMGIAKMIEPGAPVIPARIDHELFTFGVRAALQGQESRQRVPRTCT